MSLVERCRGCRWCIACWLPYTPQWRHMADGDMFFSRSSLPLSPATASRYVFISFLCLSRQIERNGLPRVVVCRCERKFLCVWGKKSRKRNSMEWCGYTCVSVQCCAWSSLRLIVARAVVRRRGVFVYMYAAPTCKRTEVKGKERDRIW